jgi:NADPH:quinone reductase-like Zn-dependent oxidoreductase
MRLVRLKAPGDLDNLKLVEEDHPNPRPGELLIRIRAASLNFHDDLVAHGKIPCADGRIPLSDGAGEVLAVGDDVNEFEVADNVVSTFWPYWLGGEMRAFRESHSQQCTLCGGARARGSCQHDTLAILVL